MFRGTCLSKPVCQQQRSETRRRACSKVQYSEDSSHGERPSYFDAWQRAETALQTKSVTEVTGLAVLTLRSCAPCIASC